MKHSLLFLFFFLPLHAQTFSPDIEIVESTPVGTILANPEIRNAHDVWLQMIGRAQRSLDIEEFYIANEPGKKLDDIISAIRLAADRGVHVRIIVDAQMYKTYPETADSLGRHRNIETRVINFGKIAGGIQHSKFFIVDGREVYVGSQNFDWRSLEHIHELGIRIDNKTIARDYGIVFNYDWQSFDWQSASSSGSNKRPLFSATVGQTPIPLAVKNGDTAMVVPTFSPLGFIPDSSLWDETAIVGVIDRAKDSLKLQFLTYSTLGRRGETYTVIDDAIRRAAKRNVKVTLIAADWEKGSRASGALKSLSALQNIQVAFTAIPPWQGGYVSFARVEHCKFVVADDSLFWLGTANCEKNYYYASRNMGITGVSSALSRTLNMIFLKSWTSPYRETVTPEGKYLPRQHGEE
jgi:phosphatidylserine/phosphatidylglycerophosphate/cardiolipin synthase-like enzyme